MIKTNCKNFIETIKSSIGCNFINSFTFHCKRCSVNSFLTIFISTTCVTKFEFIIDTLWYSTFDFMIYSFYTPVIIIIYEIRNTIGLSAVRILIPCSNNFFFKSFVAPQSTTLHTSPGIVFL